MAWRHLDMQSFIPGATGDQTQPAIAINPSVDPTDRAIQGVIFVSWYDPFGSNRVARVAQGFDVVRSDGVSEYHLAPVTSVFGLESQLYSPVEPPDPTGLRNRGVYEYQGIAFLPGYGRIGGWVSTWRRPHGTAVVAPTANDWDLTVARWN